MAANKNRISITISEAAVARLRELAEGLGYVNQTGRFTGQGSVSAMLQAVGDGRLRIVEVFPPGEVARRWRRLLAQQESDPATPPAELAFTRAIVRHGETFDELSDKGDLESEVALAEASLELAQARLDYDRWRYVQQSQRPLDLGPDDGMRTTEDVV